MPEELWTEVCNTAQDVVTKTTPKKKKWQKATWLSEEGLQKVEKRRKQKAKERGKNIPNWMQSYAIMIREKDFFKTIYGNSILQRKLLKVKLLKFQN